MSYFLYTTDDDSNQKIDIDGLFEKNQQKETKQISIFNKILNRIHNRIKITSRTKMNDKYIWFNIPEYIFGEPIYDKAECIAYVISKLEYNGFYIKYMHPNTIFVSWEKWIPTYIRNKVKKQGIVIDERGNVIKNMNEEDTGDLLNPSVLHEKTNEFKNQLKEHKQYTPIDKYKPTGNLVYNQDMFEKLEKKVSF